MKEPGKRFTINEIKETYRVVYQTARNDLLTLAKFGYITKDEIKNKFVFTFTEENEEKLSNSTEKRQIKES